MSDVIQTYPVAPSIALASMAMVLAEENTERFGFFSKYGCQLRTREEIALRPSESPVSAEYYAIIDRLSRGEAP